MKKSLYIAACLALLGLFGAGSAFGGYVDHYTVNSDIGQYKAPYKGVNHVVVVRVQVNDISNPGDPPQPQVVDWTPWEQFFDNDAPGLTFRNYYKLTSMGRYDPIVTVLDPIVYDNCPAQLASFPNCSIDRGDPLALLPGLDLIAEVFQRIEAEQPNVDFRDFDINGLYGLSDGWADGVILISNLDFTGIALPTSLLYNVNITWDLCNNLITGLGPYLGGVSIDPNSICPTLVGFNPQDLIGTEFENFLGISVKGVKIGMVGIVSTLDDVFIAVHEFGHVLGFGDLYREHYSADPNYWQTIYIPGLKFSLMGSYSGLQMPQLDGVSRMRIGWANPVKVEGTMRALIPPVADTGIVYYFKKGDEMFVVENRGPTAAGMDQGIASNGLAIYHVNLRREPDPGPFGFLFMILDCLDCNDWSPFIMNEQADGLFELQQNTYRTSTWDPDADLFKTGNEFATGKSYEPPPSPTYMVITSNTYDGRYSGFSVTDIDSDSAAPYIWATLSDGSFTVPFTPPATSSGSDSLSCSLSGKPSGVDGLLLFIFVVSGWILVRRRISEGTIRV